MIMETLDTLFCELDIRGVAPEKFLESDLGLDFDERLYLREDIEERLRVVILDDDIKSDLTVLDLAGLLSRKLLITPAQEHFEGRLVEDTVISVPIEAVTQALMDVAAWPRRLSHIDEARVTYDDGLHQEFTI